MYILVMKLIRKEPIKLVTFRAPKTLWSRLLKKTKKEGYTATQVLLAGIREYLGEDGSS